MAESPLVVERHEAVAVVTMHRPHRRNALNAELHDVLVDAVAALDADVSVRAIVLTGADPAFCAGLDLGALAAGERIGNFRPGQRGPFAERTTPLIGAINGPAVTGGLELALACDLLIASDRASFADTHGRVGLLPGWGLSVLLPRAVGLGRARYMSLTGNYVDARTAASWGLVTEVVDHEHLLARAIAIGADMAGTDPEVAAALLDLYDQSSAGTLGEAWAAEAAAFRNWWTIRMGGGNVPAPPAEVIDRGRNQMRR